MTTTTRPRTPRLRITMELDGAAFNDDPQAEARRTINAALSRASWMPGEDDTIKIRDTNGNSIGTLDLCPPWPADHDTPEPDEDEEENEDEDEEPTEAEINAYVQAVSDEEFTAICVQLWEEDGQQLSTDMVGIVREEYNNHAIAWLEQRCYAERSLQRKRRRERARS